MAWSGCPGVCDIRFLEFPSGTSLKRVHHMIIGGGVVRGFTVFVVVSQHVTELMASASPVVPASRCQSASSFDWTPSKVARFCNMLSSLTLLDV